MKNIIVDVEDIVRIVASYYELTPSEMFNNTRVTYIRSARQMCQYLIRENTNLSFRLVGEVSLKYGRKRAHSHDSIIHSCKVVEDATETDKQVLLELTNLTKLIKPYKYSRFSDKKDVDDAEVKLSLEIVQLNDLNDELKSEIKGLKIRMKRMVDVSPFSDEGRLFEIFNDVDYDGKKDILLKAQTIKKVREKFMRVPA